MRKLSDTRVRLCQGTLPCSFPSYFILVYSSIFYILHTSSFTLHFFRMFIFLILFMKMNNPLVLLKQTPTTENIKKSLLLHYQHDVPATDHSKKSLSCWHNCTCYYVIPHNFGQIQTIDYIDLSYINIVLHTISQYIIASHLIGLELPINMEHHLELLI